MLLPAASTWGLEKQACYCLLSIGYSQATAGTLQNRQTIGRSLSACMVG